MKACRVKGLDPQGTLADNAERIVRVRLSELQSFIPQALEHAERSNLRARLAALAASAAAPEEPVPEAEPQPVSVPVVATATVDTEETAVADASVDGASAA